MENDILKKVKSFYETAVRHNAYIKWREEATESWCFYDGEQWTADEKEYLKSRAQPAIVINKIATKIDNIAGSEISGRTRILYRSRSGDKKEEETARALSDLGLYVAENNNQSRALSDVFKEGLIAGISWLDTGVERAEEGVHIYNKHENTFNVVWDPYFTQPDYSDARFVCRERWLDSDTLKAVFPEKSEPMIKQLSAASFSGSMQGFSSSKHDDISYVDTKNERFLIVEVQYKKTEKRYLVTEPDGRTFSTFNKKEAYINPKNKIETDFMPRVYIAYYSDNQLLSHDALGYQHNQFTLIPYVFKRDKRTGQPYGIVRHAIDPQRELNKRRSKAMHLLNTAQVIADIDAVENPAVLSKEAARPDGVILKRPGKELRILRNADLAASQVNIMGQAACDLQETMGVFDESIGKNSNATSGVAIQQRQMAGSLTQMFAFESLRTLKKILGKLQLSYIRQYFTHKMAIQITDTIQAARTIQLNSPIYTLSGEPVVDADGTPVKHNDVTMGIYDVVVDEVKDVLSSRELELNQLALLMQSGIPVPPRLLVESSNVRQKEEILKALGTQENISEKPSER